MGKISSVLILCLSLIIVLPGCSPEAQTTGSGDQKIPGLTLSSGQVTALDTLVLSFPRHHPARLAIKDPDGHFLILHDEGLITHIMSHNAYLQATSISMKISEVIGVTWVDGKKSKKKVFHLPGEYMIYMADNLETEPENTFYLMATVNYKLGSEAK